jgi:hypothetical protein
VHRLQHGGHAADVGVDLRVGQEVGRLRGQEQGPMLWFFKNIFENMAKNGVLTRNKATLCKHLIVSLVFEKNANCFAENCRKSQKILIITSTPGIGSVVVRSFYIIVICGPCAQNMYIKGTQWREFTIIIFVL